MTAAARGASMVAPFPADIMDLDRKTIYSPTKPSSPRSADASPCSASAGWPSSDPLPPMEPPALVAPRVMPPVQVAPVTGRVEDGARHEPAQHIDRLFATLTPPQMRAVLRTLRVRLRQALDRERAARAQSSSSALADSVVRAPQGKAIVGHLCGMPVSMFGDPARTELMLHAGRDFATRIERLAGDRIELSVDEGGYTVAELAQLEVRFPACTRKRGRVWLALSGEFPPGVYQLIDRSRHNRESLEAMRSVFDNVRREVNGEPPLRGRPPLAKRKDPPSVPPTAPLDPGPGGGRAKLPRS